MGASIGIAQGFKWAGIKKPVIATIGDSTFFMPVYLLLLMQSIKRFP